LESIALRYNFDPPRNIWKGYSASTQKDLESGVVHLVNTPAAVRFLSLEPLVEDVGHIVLDGKIHLVIVGGESGPKARPCAIQWIRSIVQQCKSVGVPCFVKQLGANPVSYCSCQKPYCTQHPPHPSAFGGGGKNGDPAEWPEDLRVRQMPEVGDG
jgi:protein gp37